MSLVSVGVVLFFNSPGIYALTPDQQEIFNEGINYFDTAVCGSGDNTTTASTSGTPAQGPLYILGDSILLGAYFNGVANGPASGPLKKDLDAVQLQSSADASGGRGMHYPGTAPAGGLPGAAPLSGLDAINADQATIKSAGSVVIELGTNEDNSAASAADDAKLFTADMHTAIKEVRSINSNVQIYWVNLFSKTTTNTPHIDAYNQAIKAVAASDNISVIDTTQANISLSSDGIHPDTTGYQTLSKTITDQLTNPGGGSGGSAGSSGGTSYHYIAIGNIPVGGEDVGASTFGGGYIGGTWTPTNDVQGGATTSR